MKTAIAVTGYPSSGKSIANEIAEELGLETVTMGDQVRRKTKEVWGDRLSDSQNGSSNEIPSDVYGEFATEMRNKHGRGVVAEWCLSEIEDIDGTVFIDGMRSPVEMDILNQSLDLNLIFIHAPANMRLEWIVDRDRDNESEFDAEKLLKRDRRENDWGLNELIQRSHYTVHNCTTIENYKSELKERMLDIINS